jgi:hypothetical protein
MGTKEGSLCEEIVGVMGICVCGLVGRGTLESIASTLLTGERQLETGAR